MTIEFTQETLILGIDTETSGFPTSKLHPRDPKQGRIVQLALKLVRGDRKVIGQYSTLIRPDGWQMHEKAQEVHGHSIEDCYRFGSPAAQVFAIFLKFAETADIFVAHNAQFDERVVTMEASALSAKSPGKPWYCTMKECKGINLGAALEHYCGRERIGGHDAMVDVTDCLDVFFELQKRKAAA